MVAAHAVHQQAIIVDGHCDTILELLTKRRSFWDDNKKGQLDWPKVQAGKINLQFLACYLEPEYKPYGALSRVLELLDHFHLVQEEGRKQGRQLEAILSREQLQELGPQDFKVLLAIEGGEVLEGKLSNLRILAKLGFRSLTLTWNQRNQIADGVGERESKGGLTTFGKGVIQEMNRLGMLIDVSHLNEAGFWDVLELSAQPITASHSCCRVLCNHPRNLWDDQLRALQAKGGVVGINFYPGFLGKGKVTAERVIEHIEYAAGIAGVASVGLGSDFDGINTTPLGLENAALMPLITEKLLTRGWPEEDVMKILGGNFLRVLSKVLPYKEQSRKTDLHVHTRASDGAYDPAEIVKIAQQRKINVLAITDHDTIAGLQEAREAAQKYGLVLVPGVELSTILDDKEIHILGYQIDPQNPELLTKLKTLSKAREERAQLIVAKLNHLGYEVTMDEVRAKAGSEIIGRPHIALVLKEQGIIKDISEGFARFLGQGGAAYVPRFRLSSREAIQMINHAGGVAVLAHPGLDFPSRLLAEFINWGLGGIEVYHPDNSPQIRDYYQRRAQEAGILITGGSDFHGHEANELQLLGQMYTPPETLLRLQELSAAKDNR